MVRSGEVFSDPDQRGGIANGDRVAAKVNGRIFCFKQLVHDGTKPYLKPLNRHYLPIFEEFRILGKVIEMWVPE